MRLDRYDTKILHILATQGRITKSHLAEAINLSVSPCWERVRRLEEAGIIEGYGAKINPGILAKKTPVLVEVTLGKHDAESFGRFEQAMQACPEVVDCFATGGGVDYILRVMAKDIDQYQRLVDSWLMSDLGIERYYTYIVTKTIKHQQEVIEIDENLIRCS
ncbi:Lrp/AsnC family transcriptional regulator [Grimontia hollisae]|uniref:Transcriptional regulator AsnC family n=1 Tax=Grimontia hollisae CIP 101886 TaxID=675812 RepID=D0I5C3_GRIHO|nr:Lrp/AsnC family transcriptional regulator [Grimontia hollisae]AMG29289.1 Lrp/AsnC family transcriptional regulator [Grimontia hollisae]EEY73087.1 transcriptional regulator AsnC family [Grimontia hollisae CIP 101886]MDF2183912.1 Lrp/AsnC family transcriptional regulator [Grimontia hollisae]STO77778.1 Leucine-responsive regulatory protein [Grimontia hollisae]STQ76207.1 Leucine-responsive regulatory protein [Grimontia hollisae]